MSPDQSQSGGWMSRVKTRLGIYGALLACALAGTMLVQTGVANAASRGFKVKNDSKHSLRLVGASAVPRVLCVDFRCVPTYYDIGFEGRPADGAVLAPRGEQTWELKYTYNPTDIFGVNYNYEAKLTYAIEGTAGKVEAVIKTSNYVNDSTCAVTPTDLGSCTAEGLKITLR